jgi:hypothetical protein
MFYLKKKETAVHENITLKLGNTISLRRFAQCITVYSANAKEHACENSLKLEDTG